MTDDEYTRPPDGQLMYLMVCDRCGAIVDREQVEEHTDWHDHLDDSIDHLMRAAKS